MYERSGDGVRKYRLERGWSQKDLAKAVFVSQVTVSGWETGKRNLSVEQLKQVAKALEVPLLVMLGFELADLVPAVAFLAPLPPTLAGFLAMLNGDSPPSSVSDGPVLTVPTGPDEPCCPPEVQCVCDGPALLLSQAPVTPPSPLRGATWARTPSDMGLSRSALSRNEVVRFAI